VAQPQPMALIPSPPSSGFSIGPVFVHVYDLMYVVGITVAAWITRRRWRAAGGDPTLVWLGRHRAVRPPGLFALYVTGYSAFRIFKESLRVDPSEHFLGLRLNLYVAAVLTLAGAAWFWRTQQSAASAAATATGQLEPEPANQPDQLPRSRR
jgi:prolipoprotein diacylglyceryltransferase